MTVMAKQMNTLFSFEERPMHRLEVIEKLGISATEFNKLLADKGFAPDHEWFSEEDLSILGESISAKTIAQPKSKATKSRKKPAPKEAIASSIQASQGAITNVFKAQTVTIATELQQAIDVDQAFVEDAATVLAEMHRTRKARIYAIAAQKIESTEPELNAELDFSDLFDFEMPAIPAMESSSFAGLLTATVAPH